MILNNKQTSDLNKIDLLGKLMFCPKLKRFNLFSVTFLAVFSIIIITGCGGGGGGSSSNPIAPVSNNAVISGNVILPSGTGDISTITSNIRAGVLQDNYARLEVCLLNLRGENILTPVSLADDGSFAFTNVPSGNKYSIQIRSKTGNKKCILQAFVDSFDGTNKQLNINHSSTAISVLVAMNGYKNTAQSIENAALSNAAASALINQIAARVSEIIKGTTSISSGEDLISNVMATIDNTALTNAMSNLETINEAGAPQIELSGQLDGKFYEVAQSLELIATGSENIARVIFFKGSEKLGEDASAPFSFNWTNLPEGNWVITARAIDNNGKVGFSNRVKIKVGSLTLVTNEVRFSSPVSAVGNELNTLSMQIRIKNVPDNFDLCTLVKCLPTGSYKKWKRSPYVNIPDGIALVFVDGISFATVMEFDRLQFSAKLPAGATVEIYNKDKSKVVASATVPTP